MEYKIWHNWVGRMVHRELCKRLNFDHTIKYYMHKPESVQEKMRCIKFSVIFKIQTDPLISARRPDLVLLKKKKKKKKK